MVLLKIGSHMIMQLLPKQIFPGFLILYCHGAQNNFDTSSFQLPAFVVQPKHSDTRRTVQNESYAWIDFQSSATLLLDYVECLSAPHENAAFTVNFLFPIFNHLLFMHFSHCSNLIPNNVSPKYISPIKIIVQRSLEKSRR